MERYVALDVSLKEISVCVLDEKGGVVFEGKTAAEPAVLVDLIRSKAPGVVRIGLETGATAPRLLRSLTAAGLPASVSTRQRASCSVRCTASRP
jgi:hypothetical protein